MANTIRGSIINTIKMDIVIPIVLIVSAWILRTGLWDETGHWEDEQNWIDEEYYGYYGSNF